MQKRRKNESGEVMIEGMIVIIFTIIMLVWILGIFFLYYQKYTVRIATNDVAKKVASTYDVPSSELVMGYLNETDIKNRKLYFDGAVDEANLGRADSYVKYILDRTNFNGAVQEVKVFLAPRKDTMGRSHLSVTTECKFKTPFSEALEWVGMSGEITYRVTSYADSTSLTDYVSTVGMAKSFTTGAVFKAPGIIGSTVKMINSFMGMFGQLTADNGSADSVQGGLQ